MSKQYESYCDPALVQEAIDLLNLEDFERPALAEVPHWKLLLSALEDWQRDREKPWWNHPEKK